MNFKTIIFFLILLLISTNVFALNSDNLVSWWKYNETTGSISVDSVGDNNLGTSYTTINQSGKIDKAIITTATNDTGIGYI